jgi:transposase
LALAEPVLTGAPPATPLTRVIGNAIAGTHAHSCRLRAAIRQFLPSRQRLKPVADSPVSR